MSQQNNCGIFDFKEMAIKIQLATPPNKKSELMLMRRVRAFSSSCLQVIMVYVHCPSISLQFTLLQPKIVKKSQKR